MPTRKTKSREGSGSLRAAVLSDIGKVRRRNEDAFALLPERGLLIVSDGMGGLPAGAEASKIVVTLLSRIIEKGLGSIPLTQTDSFCQALRDVIVVLSQKVWQESDGRPGLSGMGATVVMACIRGGQAYIAHMGDSRAYLSRNGTLTRLTEDHSVVGILLRDGTITPEEAKTHPARNMLSRFVGMKDIVFPDVQALALSEKDRLLLCTDGLTSMVGDEAIAKVMAECEDPQAACRSLVNAANAAGGRDNITVLVADWHGRPKMESPATQPARRVSKKGRS